MKYGLLYYKDTDNIGDDIQTYAQKQFLPRIDYLIDRESLNLFVPNEKEKVATIMNAWYLHNIGIRLIRRVHHTVRSTAYLGPQIRQ